MYYAYYEYFAVRCLRTIQPRLDSKYDYQFLHDCYHRTMAMRSSGDVLVALTKFCRLPLWLRLTHANKFLTTKSRIDSNVNVVLNFGLTFTSGNECGAPHPMLRLQFIKSLFEFHETLTTRKRSERKQAPQHVLGCALTRAPATMLHMGASIHRQSNGSVSRRGW